MEGDLYPVLLLTHFFSKWMLASETINSMVNEASFCTVGLYPIKVLNPVSVYVYVLFSSLLITTHLQTQPNMETQKGMKRSGLIPPRMQNKWKLIIKSRYQTENK